MGTDVTVLRVFTDAEGDFGNPLGVVDAAAVPPGARQQMAAELGYSETVFIDLPEPGSATAHAHIFTPVTEMPFAGHPTVGAAWWLRAQSMPVRTLQVPAGIVAVRYHADPTGDVTSVVAHSSWAPEFVIHEVASADDLAAATPDDYPADVEHYLWTWTDHDRGEIRARMFAANLGVPEDEATGAAAVRITDHLNRDLRIVQGKGSQIFTTWNPEGWVGVAGRVVSDGVRVPG